MDGSGGVVSWEYLGFCGGGVFEGGEHGILLVSMLQVEVSVFVSRDGRSGIYG